VVLEEGEVDQEEEGHHHSRWSVPCH